MNLGGWVWYNGVPLTVFREEDEVRMIRYELTEKEKKILQALARRGAMSPGQVSAETWLLPGETLTALKELANAGLVLMRADMNSPDGMLVAITSDARAYLNGNKI
ncbi:MAG: MarR family transcriptional regulator [Chloroflexi bacterium]|nr:MAG: MarR family transcriptional regulator [Chloroflexota bacterium]